jgi:hypothetical protein
MQDWWQKFKTYWNRLSTTCKGTIAICLPLVCLISAVVTHSFFSHRIMTAQQEIVLSNEILGTSQRIAISLAKAESAVCARYGSSTQTIQPKLDNLARSVCL